MGRTAVALGVCITVWGTVASSAQTKPRLTFEVASVRVFSLNSGFRNLHRTTQARVERIRSVGMLLMEAFRQPTFYRLDSPDWVNEVMVEIQATMPAGATMQHVPEMLQTLLEDRFGLVTRRESRQVDGYELLVAETGIRMREVEPLDELEKKFAADPSIRPSDGFVRETPDGPVRTIQASPGGFRRITSRTMYDRITVPARGGSVITAARMSMAELITELETNVDRPIVDRTGLTSLYQFTLKLPYDAVMMRMDAVVAAQTGRPVGAGAEASGGVSLFRELEGLGLKLERRRVPIEFIVVDKLSRTPTEN